MTQAICDITTDEVNVDVVVEPQADTMVEVANRAGGMEQVFHDNTLIGNGNSVDLGVNTEIIASREYVDEKFNSVDTYTKTEIDHKVTVINAEIDANADAIQKTRDDYIEADSEIHQVLNNHASELTTLRGNQASLGDQVSGIEEKIPESASGSNPLITKQQLLDEEMDIRDDLNEMSSELQTQITAQAAEIATKQDQLTAGDNIIISNNVISATGAGGGAGFDIQVVQELPATGQKGIIYLLAKDGTAPDVYDEYVWITATQTFELIGTTQVDLTDYAKKVELDNYLPLSGGTMAGSLLFEPRTGHTFEIRPTTYGNLEFRVRGLQVVDIEYNTGLVPNGIGTYSLGRGGRVWKNVYTQKLNNGADLIVPTEGGTLARLEDLEGIGGGGASLPDQAGNAGKFLKTDGATASWANALENIAPEEYGSIVVGSGATTPSSARGAVVIGRDAGMVAAGNGAVAIGDGAGNFYSGVYSVAIGYGAQAGSGTAGAIAIGGNAQASAKCAIQLGAKGSVIGYTNSDANTFKVGNANGNFEMMSADGTIPAARMSATAGVTGQVLTKTDTGMAWSDAKGAGGASLPILMSVWADHQVNNESWLRADTFSWHSGGVYVAAYEHLVADIDGKTTEEEIVGGITVYFYRADDGHKICLPDQESNLSALYESTGVAWYYLLDTANKQFKLPRTKYGFNGLRDSVGGYIAPGLPNITGTFTNNGHAGYADATGAFTSTKNGTHSNEGGASDGGFYSFDASRSSSIYGNSDTVQVPATQMYLYFYVGNFEQSATEQTAGLNAELFNGKADRNLLNTTDNVDFVIESQLPTADNGYTWYRKYKSGWVEQGGRSTSQTVTLPVEMADTSYVIQLTSTCSSVNNNVVVLGYRDLTTTGFTVQGNVVNNKSESAASNNSTKHWCVCGMSAQ